MKNLSPKAIEKLEAIRRERHLQIGEKPLTGAQGIREFGVAHSGADTEGYSGKVIVHGRVMPSNLH